jgi:hypothetical protein
MSIKFNHRGDFLKTERFLRRADRALDNFDYAKYGEMGVIALRQNTPKDTGKTADSWSYEVIKSQEAARIIWKNSNIVKGVPIAIILQYGHGTRNGGYVQGRDYINPSLQPVFDKMAEDMWKEVRGR